MGTETQTSSERAATPGELAILGYHKIGEPPGNWWTWNYIPENLFVEQLHCLNEGGWTVVDHDEFLRGLESSAILPPKAALITFDDGYRSFLHSALPVLQRFDFPAVLFVPTALVGRTNEFDRGIEPDEAICDWGELQLLIEEGVAVQSHGVSHQRFSELDVRQIREELEGSKDVLESRLGRAVETFSFPYGDEGRDSAVTRELLIEAGYRAAFRYGGGVSALDSADRYRLSRLPIGPDTNLSELLGSAEQGSPS